MTREQTAHIEPSLYSTEETDEFLRQVDGRVDVSLGAGSLAIKLSKDLLEGGKPNTDTPNTSGT